MRTSVILRLTALVVWGILLVGVAGAVVALRSPGGEEVFLAEQSRSPTPTVLVAHPPSGLHIGGKR